ncbi:MAG TPA: glycosyltransferase [Prolixibacteraceae bacterium]|jgi:mannosyltransferase OCH1-like enzyme
MIPKKIHYCWYGKNPLPTTERKCIATWKTHLSDYEFKLWDESNSPMDHPFVKQAYKTKKYAFVADYVRLWALYNEGGIYLDTDMYVIKNFNELLVENVFFGYEIPANNAISAGIIGSHKNNDFIYQVLNEYDHLLFENSNIMNIKIPAIITKTFSTYEKKKSIKLFPFDFFYPFPFEKRHEKNEFLDYITEHTLAIHLWNLSWLTWKDFVFYKYSNIRDRIIL